VRRVSIAPSIPPSSFVHAPTGAFLSAEDYRDTPLIHRIHSGEFFGDGGLVVSMIWGLALFVLTNSGFLLYWRLYQIDRPGRTGLRKTFSRPSSRD
jgi:uncharacterized iron-regulated membrane protein